MSHEIKNPLLKKFLSVFEEARSKENKTTLPLPENAETASELNDTTPISGEQLNGQTIEAIDQQIETVDNKEQISPETVTYKPEPETAEIPLESEIGETSSPEQTTETSADIEQGSIAQEETEMTTPEPGNTEPTTETIPENVTQQTTPPEQ
ncbi:MAG TPA: hypothetical protein PK715_07820, partial [Chitinophagales bacterium]|nr:hypothetical protein [Chitinophagales bacterium]